MEQTYVHLATLVLAIFVGVCLFILSRYVRIPAIVLLLVGGVILGPEALGLIDPASLGEGLRLIIFLCVAIILFEGGLTLHPEGLRKAPKVIWRLLTIGVLITWLGTAALMYFLLNFSPAMSLLAGSLIIVTGPTVIAPLLKRIQIKEKLYHILHWEGVLIDPVGVFIAILCFEWLSSEGSLVSHFGQFSIRVFVGILFGYIGGKVITWLLNKELIPEEQSSIFVFTSGLFLFAMSDFVIHEAGILTVVIAGLVIGWANPPQLKHIQKFKSELTELSIVLVFILLAANLQLENFANMGWNVVIVLGAVLFVIRPLSIMLCSFGTNLSFNERLFLSWIAPRGVIAGSMASLFGLQLMSQGHPEAVFLETFTFSVIAITIILQGITAGGFAKLLKVEQPEKKGWLIVGAHSFSRTVADFIRKRTENTPVFLDTNSDAIRETHQEGFLAFRGNALSVEAIPPEIYSSIGYVLAMTDNRDLNQLICEKWSEVVDKNNLFRWSSQAPEVEEQIAGMGIPIWGNLTRPSQISYDINHKEILVHQKNSFPENRNNRAYMPIMAIADDQIQFDVTDAKAGEVKVLMLERISRHLRGLLNPQQILFIESDRYENALKEVLEKVKQLYPELPFDQISASLLERELDFPTTLAHGVAAPHLHTPSLTEQLCFVVHISKGIELHTYEGELVQLLFVLFSPESQPELHLRSLAEIAKIASDAELVEKLIAANTADEIIALMSEKRT